MKTVNRKAPPIIAGVRGPPHKDIEQKHKHITDFLWRKNNGNFFD